MREPWVGFDLDGTLAHYESSQFPGIGAPVPAMVTIVKGFLAAGVECRVVTARAVGGGRGWVSEMEIARVEDWCELHLGVRLKVTNEKDYDMVLLFDDRAVSVEPNTGRLGPRPERFEPVLTLFDPWKTDLKAIVKHLSSREYGVQLEDCCAHGCSVNAHAPGCAKWPEQMKMFVSEEND